MPDCTRGTYEGADYSQNGLQGIGIPGPQYGVAHNTVTYVRGQGLSIRMVTIPGSDQNMFLEETAQLGLCNCSPPCVWLFVGVDPATGQVAQVQTLDGHEAAHLLQHPDHLFEDDLHTWVFDAQPVLVAESEGLGMVVAELEDWLRRNGSHIEGHQEDVLGWSDVTSVDIDELAKKFFENEGDTDGPG